MKWLDYLKNLVLIPIQQDIKFVFEPSCSINNSSWRVILVLKCDNVISANENYSTYIQQ